MEYITVDGHFTIVYGYHFSLLNHFCNKVMISLPYYLRYSLKKSLEDNKKNPNRFSILHTGLIRLIVEYFQNKPTPTTLDTTLDSESDDTNPSGSEYIPNPSSARKVLSSHAGPSGKRNPTLLSGKAHVELELDSPSLHKKPQAKSLVCYFEESSDLEEYDANKMVVNVKPMPDKHAEDDSPINLNSEKIVPNIGDEPSLDFLNLAKANSESHSKLLDQTFIEINELKIKSWALQSKIEVLVAKVVQIEKNVGDRGVHGHSNRDTNSKIDYIMNTIKTVAEQNNRMARHNAIIINAMGEKLDKTQQGSLVVDLEETEDKSQDTNVGISKRARSNLKCKVPRTSTMIQTFKKDVIDMHKLEEETESILKTLK